MNVKSGTIWFSGLHGSGKTTIAKAISEKLRFNGIKVVVLDGDELRKGLSADLNYSLEERNKHLKRVANICKIISENDVLNIACVASPTEKSRTYAKGIISNFFEVYIKCPLQVCEQRDVKGHYKRARAGEAGFENFLGINLTFEEPKSADFVLETDKEPVNNSVEKLFNKILEKNWLK